MKKIIIVVMLFASFVGVQKAYAAIMSPLDLGSTGAQVRELQTYLAANPQLYPSGLITGYFGPLTQAGVQKFQIAQGIVSEGTPETTGFGRVGPRTLLKINLLTGTDGGLNVTDAAPILSNINVQYASTSATFTWTTNKPAQGQVYFDNAPLRVDEATGPHQQPFVSGMYSFDGGNAISHSINVANLKSDTAYYYLLRSVDNTGNLSMTLPSSFRTNP